MLVRRLVPSLVVVVDLAWLGVVLVEVLYGSALKPPVLRLRLVRRHANSRAVIETIWMIAVCCGRQHECSLIKVCMGVGAILSAVAGAPAVGHCARLVKAVSRHS